MHLSEHFTYEEIVKSNFAEMRAINNEPTIEHMVNIMRYLIPGLEDIRALLGNKAIRITSAYRSPFVNDATGGVRNSAHASGFAADFVRTGMNTYTAGIYIAESGLVFDQLIYEKGRGVLHISFDPRKRREILTQRGPAGTAFVQGIRND